MILRKNDLDFSNYIVLSIIYHKKIKRKKKNLENLYTGESKFDF